MNLNIEAIWEEFKREASKFENQEEAVDFVYEKYNMSPEESRELVAISLDALSEYFNLAKLNKKNKNTACQEAIQAIFINGTFFGLYLGHYLKYRK
jgi:hypothetical protein